MEQEPTFVYRDGMTAEKSHQLGGQLEMPKLFGRVPWKHHVYIVSNSHSIDEAIFYINKVAEEGWSRSCLKKDIEEDEE